LSAIWQPYIFLQNKEPEQPELEGGQLWIPNISCQIQILILPSGNDIFIT
jgi:hypothetical protein